MVVAAFIIGRLSVTSDINTTNITPNSATINISIAEESQLFNVKENIPQAQASHSAYRETVQEDSNEPNTINKIVNISDLLNAMIGHDYATIAKAQTIIEGMSEQEIVDALAYLSAFVDDHRYEETLKIVLGQYATYSSMDAMLFIDENVKDSYQKIQLSNVAMSKWAANDPIAGVEWFKNANDSKDMFENGAMLETLFEGVANQNLAAAIDFLSDFEDNNRLFRSAINGISSTLTTSADFISFLEKTGLQTDKSFTNTLYFNWAKSDSKGLQDWVGTIDDPQSRESLKKRLLDPLRSSNLSDEELAIWYLADTPPEMIEHKVNLISINWASRDPESLLEWISIQAVDQSKARYNALFLSARQNPDFANSELERLTSVEQKVGVSRMIYDSLKNNKSEQIANAFLQSSPYKEQLEIEIKKHHIGFLSRKLNEE